MPFAAQATPEAALLAAGSGGVQAAGGAAGGGDTPADGGEAPAKRTGENLDRIKAKRWNRKDKPGARVIYPNIYRMLDRGIGGSRPIKPRPLFSKIMGGKANKVRGSVESATSRVLATKIRRR